MKKKMTSFELLKKFCKQGYEEIGLDYEIIKENESIAIQIGGDYGITLFFNEDGSLNE